MDRDSHATAAGDNAAPGSAYSKTSSSRADRDRGPAVGRHVSECVPLLYACGHEPVELELRILARRTHECATELPHALISAS